MAGLLSFGMIGPEIAKLQGLLNAIQPALGVPLATDGIFGPKTLATVKTFQSRSGLVPDGIVGPKTNLVLISATPPSPAAEYVGFTDDQIKAVREDIDRAKLMLNTTIDMLALVPFIKKTPKPDIKAVALKNIFHIDYTLEVDSPEAMVNAGFNAINTLILTRSLQAVRNSLDEPFPKVFHPPGSAPPAPNVSFFAAWVDTATFEPTMHISHNYFDPVFVPDGDDRSLTVIHERAHTILKLVGHPGTGDSGFPDGKPHKGSHLIKTFDVAQKNAYAYEWLIECFQSKYDPAGPF
jgi:hypothetical protein